MSNEKNEVKRCFFCHKRIFNNKDLICKRCWLQGKDVGEKIVGSLAAAGTVVLGVLAAIGNASNSGDSDDD